MTHTILLVQPEKSPTSRTFMDFESVPQAMDGICGMFERKLKTTHRNQPNITYSAEDLFRYIDGLPDLVAMVLNQQMGAYVPHNKEWIKQKTFDHLKKQMG
ncbi:unnamed protein product [Pedinophyceae sp. YPF-701]|nr:unnamed protein product [Pedinophyceae sp. YPF-701]